MISVRIKKHGTCLRNGRGCAAWALISYCNHVVVSDTSSSLCIMCCMNVFVVGCPILSSMHEHVLINHRGVGIAIYCNHVLCATSSNLSSCIACMCCRMSSSIKHVWAFPDLSSRCGHRSLFQSCCCWCYVIQPVHHILHECVVGCPILSSMYGHVPIYLQLHVSSWTVHLYTFLLSLHSNFSPSRPLQLWFEAACETSFAGHIYAMQSTPKSRRGATALFVSNYVIVVVGFLSG